MAEAMTVASIGPTRSVAECLSRLDGLDRVLAADAPVADSSGGVTVDLRSATRTDPMALLHSLGTLSDCQRRGLYPTLRLPASHKARDFLRAWRFPHAATLVAGRRFGRLLAESDRDYVGEGQRHFTGVRSTNDPVVMIYDRLLQTGFFSLQTHMLDGIEADTAVVTDQLMCWQQPLITELLLTYLGAATVDVSRILIYELVANAVQHPDARVLAMTSKLDGIDPADSNAAPMLSVGIWDDGTGILETLKGALLAGQQIRTQASDLTGNFVPQNVAGWDPSLSEYPAWFTPDATSSDGEIFLASLLPGISQKAYRLVKSVRLPDGRLESDHPGTGLYHLCKFVVHATGGTLLIRSGKQYMRIRRDQGGTGYEIRYAADVISGLADFAGNLVVARVPLAAGNG